MTPWGQAVKRWRIEKHLQGSAFFYNINIFIGQVPGQWLLACIVTYRANLYFNPLALHL
jgi:hypothetical protein